MDSIDETVSTPQALSALHRSVEASIGSLFNVNAPAVETVATDERISEFQLTTDSVNLLLAEVNCPVELRALIDALIGVAGSRRDEWFEVSDSVIAQRMEKSERTVARYRDKLAEWQTENSITLIEIRDEYTDAGGNRHSHGYHVHLSRLAVEILDDAKDDSLEWRKNHGVAMQSAAKRKRDELPNMPARTHRGRKFEPDAETLINKNLRTAATLLRKVEQMVSGIELTRSGCGNNEPFILNPEPILNIKQTIAALSSRTPGDHDGERVHQPSYKLVDKENTAGRCDEPRRVLSEEGDRQNVCKGNIHSDALRSIEAFESVGADTFGVTLRDEVRKAGTEYKHDSGSDLTAQLNNYFQRNADTMTSIIVRPRGAVLIQLDDLLASQVERLRQFSFLIVETSAENYQVWIALPKGTDEKTRQLTRWRLIKRLKADKNASGAMRMPGSINRKPERQGFRVRLTAARHGQIVTVEELDASALLAPAPILAATITSAYSGASRRLFPDYQQCLVLKNGNRSDSDAMFLWIAIERGFTFDEAWAELVRVAWRTKLNRPSYKQSTRHFVSH